MGNIPVTSCIEICYALMYLKQCLPERLQKFTILAQENWSFICNIFLGRQLRVIYYFGKNLQKWTRFLFFVIGRFQVEFFHEAIQFAMVDLKQFCRCHLLSV